MPFSLLKIALVLSAGTLVGCGSGDNGPRQHHVTGSISYDGKPIPVGRISFVPDEATNSGPPGYAVIQQGKFDTRRAGGKPSISGQLNVIVTHYGEPNESGQLPEKALFDNYSVSKAIDAKKGLTQMDFDIPVITPPKKRR